MFVRIADDYRLCSWEHLTNVIYHRRSGRLLEVPGSDFNVLLMADGVSDMDPFINPKNKQIIQKYLSSGIIECDKKPNASRKDYFAIYSNRCVYNVMWSITGFCNYHCKHCLVDSSHGRLGEKDTNQVLDLIDQMALCGVCQIDLTGGEPLVRRDIRQVISRLSEKNIKIKHIYTNGALLDQSFIDFLLLHEQKPVFVFSYDGMDGWHDWLRNTTGAEAAVTSAIQLCRENHFQAMVGLCLHKGNLPVLGKSICYLASLGVEMITIGNISMSEQWKEHASGYDMSVPEYYEACLKFIPEYYMAGCPVPITLCGIAHIDKDGAYKIQTPTKEILPTDLICPTVRTACYISADMRLLPCMSFAETDKMYDFPTIQECGGFKKALDNSTYFNAVTVTFNDFLQHNPECVSCEQRFLCGGGCRAHALLTHGDFWAKDDERCDFLKNNRLQRITNIIEPCYQRYLSARNC